MKAPALHPRTALRQLRTFARAVMLVLAATSVLAAGAIAGLNTTGKWTKPAFSLDGAGKRATAIHMAWLRGDPDWAPGNGKFHSYMLWWQHRVPECGSSYVFHGGLYGWNPGVNPTCSDSMMASGFTRLYATDSTGALSDQALDPGYNVFCSGNSTNSLGELASVGGTLAENSGEIQTSTFNVHQSVSSTQSKWTRRAAMISPRWYPSLLELNTGGMFTYSALLFARMQVLGGKFSGGSSTTNHNYVGRQKLNATGDWEADAQPLADDSVSSGSPASWLPTEYPAAAQFKASSSTARTYLFGGKDTITTGGPQGTTHADTWMLEHVGDANNDVLRWRSVASLTSGSNNDLPPALWKASLIVDKTSRTSSATAEFPNPDLWLFGGTNDNLGPNAAVYRGQVLGTHGYQVRWRRFTPSGGPGARYNACAVYDSVFNRLLVFGGYTSGGTVADNTVYALDLTSTTPTWSTLNVIVSGPFTAAPAARAEASMVKEANSGVYAGADESQEFYLFGGKDGSGALLGDLWRMWIPNDDPTEVYWEPFANKASAGDFHPAPRKGAILTRDTNSWDLRLFGGELASGASDDTVWVIDALTTQQQSTACRFDARPWTTQYSHPGGGLLHGVGFADPFALVTQTIETRASSTASWTAPTDAKRWQHQYPLLFQLPSGLVFDATGNLFGNRTWSFDLNPSSNAGHQDWNTYPFGTPGTGDSSRFLGGAAVMRVLADRTVQIMKCGSKEPEAGATSIGSTAFLNIASNGSTVGWKQSANMIGRAFHNLVTLPDGRVIVMGGHTKVDKADPANNRVSRPQIWDPAANGGLGSWTSNGSDGGSDTLATDVVERGYHSVAILMPDSRIITGGGNDELPADNKSLFELYCPPYLFDASGNRRAVPYIVDGPDSIQFNSTFTIEASGQSDTPSQNKICLIRPGADTHGFNQDQHYIELTFSQCASCMFVTAPSNLYAPPGDYLLFLVVNGSPSLGKWVRITADGSGAGSGCSCGGGGDGGGDPGDYMLMRSGAPALHASSTLTSAPVADPPGKRFLDNTLFAGVADGTRASDRLALPHGPVVVGDTLRVRLRHHGSGHDAYERVRLVALDHSTGQSVAAADSGEAGGTASAAVSVAHANGHDFSTDLAGGKGFDGQIGDAAIVDRGVSAAGDLWIETSGYVPDGGIRIETQSGGAWQEVATHYPRAESSREIIPDVPAGLVRLTFLGAHHVSGVGRFTPASSPPTRTELAPVAVRHSRSGAIDSAAEIDVAGGDSAWVDFPAIAAPAAGVQRDWFLEVTGRPVGYQPGALAARVRRGPTIDPEVSSPKFEFRVFGNVPNPFRHTTRVLFELPRAVDVRLDVYDAQGRRVRVLRQHFEAGRQGLDWDRRTEHGALAPAGVYLVRLHAGEHAATVRVVVI